MNVIEKLSLILSADTKGAVRELEKLADTAGRRLGESESSLDRWGARLTKTGALMMTAAAGISAALVSMGSDAADLAEAVNLNQQIFGDAAASLDEFAESAWKIGQSETQARTALATFGGLLSNLGMARDETVQWSKDLVTLASDMGSAFNTDPAQAVYAIGAALRGETEPIRRFNVMLDDASIKAKAVEMGLADSTSQVDKHAKAQAALALIMEQSSAIQGDYERTADGAANAQRTLRAQIANMRAELGQAAVPIMQEALGALSAMLGAFNDLSPRTKENVSQFLVLGTALLGLVGLLTTVSGWLITMRSNLALLGITSGAALGWIGALALALGALVVLWDDIQDIDINWSFGDLFDFDSDWFFGFSASIDDAADKANEAAAAFRDLRDTIEATATTTFVEVLREANNEMTRAVEEAVALELVQRGLYDALEDSSLGWAEFWRLASGDGADNYTLSTILDTMMRAGEISPETAAELLGLADALYRASEQLDNEAVALGNLTTANDDASESTGRLAYETRSATEQFNDLMDAIRYAASGELDYMVAVENLQGAIQRAVEDQDDMASSAQNVERQLQGIIEAALRGEVPISQALATGEAALDELRRTGALTDEQLQLIEDTWWRLTNAPDMKKRITIETIGSIPDASELAAAGGAGGGSGYGGAVTSPSPAIDIWGGWAPKASSMGGSRYAGQTIRVGERRPELITLGSDAYVHPAAPGGGGETVMYAYLMLNDEVLGEAIVRESDRVGGLPVRVRSVT